MKSLHELLPFSIVALFLVGLYSCEEQKVLPQNQELDVLSSDLLDSMANAIVYESDNLDKEIKSGARLLGVNIARNAVVTAESTFPGYSASKIKDGSRNTTVGGAYSWANNHPSGGRLPESVTLSFDGAKKINHIKIYTSTGYVLRDYTIQYRAPNSSSWVNLVITNGNTSVVRNHYFTPKEVSAIKIICRRGPNNQYIYGRLNEVEVYEYIPQLPLISNFNGMLSFLSEADVSQTLEYLEYQYERHDDTFLDAYGHYSDDDIGDIEELVGFIDEQPYIDFERQLGLFSKRAELSAAEEAWLASTDADLVNSAANPDYSFIQDDEVRSILNVHGEVKVGSVFYKFNADGTYFEIPGTLYRELLQLRGYKEGDAIPERAILKGEKEQTILLFPPSEGCRASKRDRGNERNGSWRYDYITSIWNHPWSSRIMAKTKSYKKKRGRWKKRRATISAKVWGTVQLSQCDFPQYLESSIKTRRRKKVKRYVAKGGGQKIRAFSGSIKSYHNSSKVQSHTNTLNF